MQWPAPAQPTHAMTESLALFPLHGVLVPGAALSLRVFEPRYLDLVRECSRSGDGFGICLLLQDAPAGDPSGVAATPAAFGTQARIEDFGSGDDGLLILRVRGVRRFRVHGTRVRDNGLIVARIHWCAPDPDDVLQPQHALLGLLLQRLLEQAGGEHAGAPSMRFDQAAWVGWRLCELLPLADDQRQALLQEDDVHARLERLLALVPALLG